MNTIYDGTFVIGDTTTTTFEAGPGISITEPSAGTLKIGSDETVLWSGTPQNSGTVQLSESIGNFDRVLFYFTKLNDSGVGSNVDTVDVVKTSYNFMHSIGTSNCWIQLARIDYNDTTHRISFGAGKNINFGAYTATSWSNPSVFTGVGDSFYLFKVVGMNRIGGNA